MIGSRLLSGAGYTLKVPAIDLAEVGAGGGSLIRIDAGGALQIGPQSEHRERRLLFVAATRARREVNVLVSGDPSPLLPGVVGP